MPDVSQGKVTSLTAQARQITFRQRLAQAARFVITGVTPDTWFGPLQPLAPMAPEDVKGRAFDYQVGINLNYTPRSGEAISFEQLRALADNCDILRGVIEARKDQIAALDWVIRPKTDLKDGVWTTRSVEAQMKSVKPEVQEQIKLLTKFFKKPDRRLKWNQWSRALLEEMFVIDAATIYKRPTRGGGLYSLELIDGATIKPLVGADGRAPLPPDPAYQQVLHGVPAADFTAQELLYLPRNVRTHRVYGYSPVEQIVVTVNTAIRRAIHQLEFFNTGSLPDSFVGLPKDWDLSKVKQFQEWFDSLMSGNLGSRRKVRFMPGEFKYQEVKPFDLKDMYDEWLARIICYVFSVSPDPFISAANRGVAREGRNRASEEGLVPSMKWLKSVIDQVIEEDFGLEDLEFAFVDNRETDPSAQANIDVAKVKAGLRTINEIRRDRGDPPVEGGDVLMVYTAQGMVPIGKLASIMAWEAGVSQRAEDLNATEEGNKSNGTEDAPSEGDGEGVASSSVSPTERGPSSTKTNAEQDANQANVD